MTVPHPGTPDAFVRLRASGWIISLCLHGTAVFLAGLFAAKLGLAPSSSSFHWEVTVVAPPAPSSTASISPREPAIAPKITRPAQRSVPTTSARPTQPEPTNPTASTPSSPALGSEPHTAAPVLPPPPQDTQQALKRPVTPPIPDPSEPASDLPAAGPAITAVPEPSPEPEPQRDISSSRTPEHTPSAELSSPLSTASQITATPAQVAALSPSTNSPTVAIKPDYGWLAATLLPRIEALKQYPMDARLKHVEGRVIVRIVIQEDGQIASATIANSSGHDSLDQAAIETIRKTSPITLSQPLEKSQVTIQIPINYQLGR